MSIDNLDDFMANYTIGVFEFTEIFVAILERMTILARIFEIAAILLIFVMRLTFYGIPCYLL